MTKKFHILIRTGNVIDMYSGSLVSAWRECDKRNKTDEHGATVVHSSHETRQACKAEFDRLHMSTAPAPASKERIETEIAELSGEERDGVWLNCFKDEAGKVVSPLAANINDLFKWADEVGYKVRWVRYMPTVTVHTCQKAEGEV